MTGSVSMTAYLLQVDIFLQLLGQLIVEVGADLLWCALEGRSEACQGKEGESTVTNQTTKRKYNKRRRNNQLSVKKTREREREILTNASGPSSMLLLVQGFQLIWGGDQGTTPAVLCL